MLVVNTLRYVFLRSHGGHWAEMLIVLQVTIIMIIIIIIIMIIIIIIINI